MAEQQDLEEDIIAYPQAQRCWSGNECVDSEFCRKHNKCKRVINAKKKADELLQERLA